MSERLTRPNTRHLRPPAAPTPAINHSPGIRLRASHAGRSAIHAPREAPPRHRRHHAPATACIAARLPSLVPRSAARNSPASPAKNSASLRSGDRAPHAPPRNARPQPPRGAHPPGPSCHWSHPALPTTCRLASARPPRAPQTTHRLRPRRGLPRSPFRRLRPPAAYRGTTTLPVSLPSDQRALPSGLPALAGQAFGGIHRPVSPFGFQPKKPHDHRRRNDRVRHAQRRGRGREGPRRGLSGQP